MAGLPLPRGVFGDGAGVLGHGEEAVLLFSAARMVSEKKIKIGGACKNLKSGVYE